MVVVRFTSPLGGLRLSLKYTECFKKRGRWEKVRIYIFKIWLVILRMSMFKL
jgi:hypothetical protein